MHFPGRGARCALAAICACACVVTRQPARAGVPERISIVRDPFVPDLLHRARPNPAVAPREGSFPNIVLPANAGAGPLPFLSGDPLPLKRSVVQAIVLGKKAHALVAGSSGTSIVGVGDRVDGAVVTAIDDRSVLLANGAVLTLGGSHP